MSRLLTIPISHYCEKARWALDRARIAYREEQHLQGLHRLATARVSQTTTVPVYVHAGGTLTESTDIVRWACPALFEHPEVDRWVAELDEWGVHTRAWVYARVFPHAGLAKRFNTARVPLWQRAMAPGLYVGLGPVINRYLELSPENIAAAERQCAHMLERVAERRGDGRRYLLGERFTAADLSFACMAAPLVLPPEYGVPLPQPRDLPAAVRREVEGYRAHPGGAYALRLFKKHRWFSFSPSGRG